jgi:hypothetical protein
MPTTSELLRAILAPVLLSAIIAAIGRWRNWVWTMPAAAGLGFLLGYALLGIPKLPPQDGTDWLFWLAIPITLLGIVDASIGGRWSWGLGVVAGGVAMVILRPIMSASIPSNEIIIVVGGVAVVGALLVWAVAFAEKHLCCTTSVVAALCIALGGAAVVVMSSNLRIVGIDGIAASAALGPVAVLVGRMKAGRSVAIVAVPILAGLLVSGHYYPEPGVSWVSWVRATVAVLSVAIAVCAVTAPTALAAKKAADADTGDPYK